MTGTQTFLPSRSLRERKQTILGGAAYNWEGHRDWDPSYSVALYRMFGLPISASAQNVPTAAGNLIYVGISRNPLVRINQHAATKNWFPYVNMITLHEYGSEKDALAAETMAIYAEGPSENLAVQHPQRYARTPRCGGTSILVLIAPNVWATAAEWTDWEGPR